MSDENKEVSELASDNVQYVKPYDVTDVTFSCGHIEILGGNVADPIGILARQRLSRGDAGLCYRCSNPACPLITA